MYCPECGHDAGEAKFCPECGADLAGVKSALKGKTTGRQGGRGGQGAGGGSRQTAAARPPARGLSPAVIWGGFGAVAVVVIVVVVMLSGGFGGSGAPSGSGAQSAAAVTAVTADTSGSYQDLVTRANGLYDQGAAKMPGGIPNQQGSAYFGAAAKVYEAAWAKQPGDPSVGTDWAISLFYSGDVNGAVKQVNVVLGADPRFQPGLFNKGIFLSHMSRLTQNKAQAQKFVDQARATLVAAIAVDPSSTVGKQADAALKGLPTPSPTK